MVSRAAQPGIRTWITALSVLMISLLSMNAIPAELPGCVGSLEVSTFSLHAYKLSICNRCSGHRCISCAHSIPIRCSLISLFIVVHLDI